MLKVTYQLSFYSELTVLDLSRQFYCFIDSSMPSLSVLAVFFRMTSFLDKWLFRVLRSDGFDKYLRKF